MKIAIIGAGAMGCLYGSYLSKGYENVWLLDVWQQHVVKIQSDGLKLVSPLEKFKAHPHATMLASDIQSADIIIIAVKSNDTAEAALLAEFFLKPDSVVLTLQNGLGNTEQLAEVVGLERLIVGMTLMGAKILEPGLVSHTGLKPTHIASWNAAGDGNLEKILKIFKRSGLETVVEKDVRSLLWSKLSIHAGINAVTALTGINNQDFLNNAEAIRLARMAVGEVVAVATVAGIPLLYPNCAEEMLEYARGMLEQNSPMLDDLMHGRITEVDAINGAVASIGKMYGVPTPVNETLRLALKTREKVIQAK